MRFFASVFLFCSLTQYASAQSWMPYDVHSGMSYMYGMVAADFNKDGVEEVAYADSTAASRTMLRAFGSGIYLNSAATGAKKIYEEDFSWHPHPYPKIHMLVERMVAIDINDDGWLDIAAVVNSHDAVVGYINPGLSGEWSRLVLTIDTPGAVNIAIADLDGDGRDDLIVTMRDQASVYPQAKPGVGWIRNMGSGQWVYSDIQVNSGMSEPRGIIPIDIFPGNGMEFIITDMATGEARFYRRWGSSWTHSTVNGVNAGGSYYNGSINVIGDELPDLVYGSADGIYAADVTYNVVNPSVVKITSLSAPVAIKVTEIDFGDLTGDGNAEIAFSIMNDGIYYLQKSSGSWALRMITPGPENYHGLKLSDYDGDGKLDVLANIEYQRNALQVWHNKLP